MFIFIYMYRYVCIYVSTFFFLPGSVFPLLLHSNTAEACWKGQLSLLPARICFCSEGSLPGKCFPAIFLLSTGQQAQGWPSCVLCWQAGVLSSYCSSCCSSACLREHKLKYKDLLWPLLAECAMAAQTFLHHLHLTWLLFLKNLLCVCISHSLLPLGWIGAATQSLQLFYVLEWLEQFVEKRISNVCFIRSSSLSFLCCLKKSAFMSAGDNGANSSSHLPRKAGRVKNSRTIVLLVSVCLRCVRPLPHRWYAGWWWLLLIFLLK